MAFEVKDVAPAEAAPEVAGQAEAQVEAGLRAALVAAPMEEAAEVEAQVVDRVDVAQAQTMTGANSGHPMASEAGHPATVALPAAKVLAAGVRHAMADVLRAIISVNAAHDQSRQQKKKEPPDAPLWKTATRFTRRRVTAVGRIYRLLCNKMWPVTTAKAALRWKPCRVKPKANLPQLSEAV